MCTSSSANAPYIPTDAMAMLPREARLHEPRIALDGGADGLVVLRRVAAPATWWLAPHGHLLVETSDRQASAMVEEARRHGLLASTARSDALDATVVIGTKPARP